MKKLSFILALVIALTGMIGLFATPVYAAGDGTEANPITVGGADADYATIGSALEAANGLAKDTVYIRVDANTTETVADITVTKNVVIYSDKTGDARPTITLAADATVGETTYHWWLMPDACALTFENVVIDTSAFNTLWNGTNKKNAGSIILKDGADVTLNNCVANNGGNSGKDGGFFYFCNSAHYGDIVVINSEVNSKNRGVMVGSGTSGKLSIEIVDSTFTTTKSPIQCSQTTPASFDISVTGTTPGATTFTTPDLCIYNRAKVATFNIVGCTFTAGSGKVVVDARNENATITANVENSTFTGGDAIKLKSKSGTVSLIGNDFTNVTGAVVNHEIEGNRVTVNSYKGQYPENASFTNITSLISATDAAEGLITAGAAQLLNGTTAEWEETSVRLVLTLTAEEAALADFTNVGVYVSLESDAMFCTTQTTEKVYTSVNAAGVQVDAATGTYYVLVEIANISNANFGTTIYVRPYVTTADGVQLGSVASFTVNGLIG